MRSPALVLFAVACLALAGCGSDTTFVVSPQPSISAVTPNAGPEAGGTLVTITGINFGGGGVSVTFGGAAATNVIVIDAQTITCVSPAGAGVSQVAVTTNDGVATASFTYGGLLGPLLSTMLPYQGLETGGFQVTLTGQNFIQGTTTVDFGGAAATNVFVVDGSTLTCIAPAGAGTVAVSVSTPNGTTGTSLPFEYFAVPVADVDLIVGSRSGDAILVFEDIVNHVGFAADRVFDSAGSQLDNAGHFSLENDNLVVSNRDDDNVLVFRNFSTLPDNSPPDVNVFLDRPTGITLVNGDIYVCSQDDDNVQIFRDVTTLVSGDAPDVTLTASGASVPFSCPVQPLVANDTLYVADRCNDRIFVWNGAAALAGNPTPDVELTLDGARRLLLDNNVLWVATDNSGAIYGYSPANGLVSGQAPGSTVFGMIQVSNRSSMAISGTNLFVANSYDVGDVILNRVDLALSTVFSQARIYESSSGLVDLYDVHVAGGLLIVSDQQNEAVHWFANANGLVDGRSPDGTLFDPRLNQAKQIIPIVNP